MSIIDLKLKSPGLALMKADTLKAQLTYDLCLWHLQLYV